MSLFQSISDATTGGLFGGHGPFEDWLGMGGGGGGGGDRRNRIHEGFDVARGYVNRGTATASDYLRQGYEDLFRSRAQGMIGGFGEAQSRYGAQAASQGLSPDVVQRMMFAPGQELQANLGQAQGEAGSGLAFDLAKLFKGTGSELAGLTQEELNLWLNKKIAKNAADSMERSGIYQGLGQLGGAAIGAGMFG